ncbi:MAG: linear amide C-N hydrolase [Mycoplasmataceae bacterium]|nr:linear amide C-N hydrolase [Mycoplasmataceae bacterium]
MCTNINLKTTNNDIITGRTNEFSGYYNSEILFLPRHHSINRFNESFNDEKIELKYAMIGINSLNSKRLAINIGIDTYLDGINEYGLSVSMLFFPEQTKFKTFANSEIKQNNLSIYLLSTILLGSCKDVNDVKKYLSLNEGDFIYLNQWKETFQFHYAITDKTGTSIVIQQENNQFVIKNNSLGVLTNQPKLKWHYENIKNYLSLDKFDHNFSNIKDNIGNLIFDNYLGSGRLGMPGDSSSPSRFIRAIYYINNLDLSSSTEETINNCFKILSTFNVPKGTEISKINFKNNGSWIESALGPNYIANQIDNIVVKDLTNQVFYWNDYENLSIRFVDLNNYLEYKTPYSIKIRDEKTNKFHRALLSKKQTITQI